MSVLELSDLVKVLEEKFGVSAQAPTLAVGVPAAGGAAVEEKSSFNIELKETGAQKIQVIKVLREALGLGLKEAKDMTDKAPIMVKEGWTRKPPMNSRPNWKPPEALSRSNKGDNIGI